MDLNTLINGLPQLLGLQGTTWLTLLIVASLVCRLVTKLIPDNKQGFLGVLRQATGIIGLYVENRISSSVTTSDAIKQIGTVARNAASRVDDVEDTISRLPVKNPKSGKFEKAS